ncbi:MAG: hypothetical protein CVV59_01150 [Tenericutes bacterium HGW-Tenericutes-4]|jgi:hypothetical protein|nr:MAG: hypothetical protein CVV59_01150 [Tenericutes bacterium HGW-Tenericutes-4]
MSKKTPNFVLENELIIIRRQIKVSALNENNVLYEYKFCMLHPKGQRSPMGYDLLELSTGKTLKGVRNTNIDKLWRQTFTNFRVRLRNDDEKVCHLDEIKAYADKNPEDETDTNMHWVSELLLLEQKTNSKELDRFNEELEM